MNLGEILDRVERRLEALGLSADAASQAAGKPDAIRNMRRAVKSGDRQGVSTSTLTALAPILGTSMAWLIDGVGDEEPETLWSIWEKLDAAQRKRAIRLLKALADEEAA